MGLAVTILTQNWSFQMTKWYQKEWVHLVAVGLVCLIIGGLSGFYGKPVEFREVTKIEYKDRVVEVEKSLSQEELNRLVDEAVKKKIHRTWTVTQKPDGTVVKTGEETTEIDKTKVEKVTEIKTVYVDKIEYRDRVVTEYKEKIVKNQPNWIVSAGVGVAIPTFLGKPEIGVPGLKGAVIQAEIGRRVVGPFYLGLTGNSQGTVGLNLSGTF